MPDRQLDRRTLLRRGGATAGAGAVMGMAGCSSLWPASASDPSVYADWLPKPDAVDTSHYEFLYYDYDDLEANEETLTYFTFDPAGFEDRWSVIDLGWKDVSTFVSAGPFGDPADFQVTVVEADFTRGDVIGDLEDADFSERSTHGGYGIFRAEGDWDIYAVGDDAVVVASPTGLAASPERTELLPTSTITAFVDAKAGTTDRYGEANEDMRVLADELGDTTAVSGWTTGNDEVVAFGATTEISENTIDHKWVRVYGSADDFDTDDLEAWVNEEDRKHPYLNGVSDRGYEKDGRVGIITGSVDRN